MQKTKSSILMISFFVLAAVFAGYFVLAAEELDVEYPVAELGNCQSEQACKTYCDEPVNISACVSFAKSHNLISEEEAKEALKFAELGTGPGGCKGRDACEAYCDDPNNMSECLAFAEQHGLMPKAELEEAKRVAQALASGAKLPGGCRGKGQCDAYCQEPSHMEECLNFAEKAGLISQEELKEARRIAPFMASGQMPGNCKNKQECENYCFNESHAEECAAFFEKAGFMSAKEAQMFRKTGGKGPGSCRSKEACDNFCNNPQNQETCFNFAMEHGLISQEDMARIQEGRVQMQNALNGAPEEVISCLKQNVGAETVENLRAGTAMPSQKIGDAMKNCYDNFAQTQVQQKIQLHIPEGASPEQASCLERILSEIQGPPSQEQQQKIATECFGAPQGWQAGPQEPQQSFPQEEHKSEPSSQEREQLPASDEGLRETPVGGSIIDAVYRLLKKF